MTAVSSSGMTGNSSDLWGDKEKTPLSFIEKALSGLTSEGCCRFNTMNPQKELQ